MHHGCVRSHRWPKREQRKVAHCAQPRSREDREPLKKVDSKSARTTTVGDLLANRWQTAVEVAPGIDQGGFKTRPGLLVWGGAPRRNRTGDPILTMDVLCRLS